MTELVYRKQIRPVLESGADVMNRIFRADDDAQSLSLRARPVRFQPKRL